VKTLSKGLSVALAASWALAGAAQPASNIFTCTNAKGQHLRSDRPIAECMDREQRVLARDGSLVRIVPPTLTLEEASAKAARERRLAAEREARREAERADQLLMQRYPNEAAHNRAREAALDPMRASLKQSEERIRALVADRKPLVDEAEFYRDRPLPAKLKQQFDAIEAAAEAQRSLLHNQQAEIARVNALYDAELARLRRLWAGAAPGSMGPVASPQSQTADTPSITLTQGN
jgi:hypothetical protein